MQPFKTSVTRPWKDIYAERFVVEKNWRSGTYKTIEYKGHKGPVTCLQYDSKRDLLVSGSSDKTARVWNAKNQSLLAVLSGHTLAIRALQFDQSKIVTGSIDGKIRIWSIQDYSCIRILDAQPDGVVCLSFNQKLLASGSVEGSIKIWDLSAGIIFNLPGHSIWTNCIQLLNQNILISSSDDASIKIWDLGSKRVIKEFKGHSGPVQKFKLLDCSSLQETDLCGKIVSASLDSTIKIWDISTETCINTLYGHSDNVWDVGCDSLRIVSGSHDKKINM
jgi:F-box/WD-40 domain protein MET30